MILWPEGWSQGSGFSAKHNICPQRTVHRSPQLNWARFCFYSKSNPQSSYTGHRWELTGHAQPSSWSKCWVLTLQGKCCHLAKCCIWAGNGSVDLSTQHWGGRQRQEELSVPGLPGLHSETLTPKSNKWERMSYLLWPCPCVLFPCLPCCTPLPNSMYTWLLAGLAKG